MPNAEEILKALAGPVLLLDDELRAVTANPAFCEILQVDAGHLKGKKVQEVMASQNGSEQFKKVLEPIVANGGEVENVEVACALPDLSEVVLKVSARRVGAAPDLPETLVVEVRNITHERNSERRIRELNLALEAHVKNLEVINHELEAFAHSVSHDLRTPLRLVNKVAHSLLSEHSNGLNGDAVLTIQMIIDGTRDMEKLIDLLLTFSGVSRSPIRKRHVNLTRLVREVIRGLRTEIVDREVEFVVDELPLASVDRDLFKQVFLNLLSNALKFTAPRQHATIRIGCTRSAGTTACFIQDNGVGFDMEKYGSLFLAFHRLHKTHEFEGSGVGLALVRRIVERHGGRIWAESKIDKGSTFYFTVADAAKR